MSKSLQMAAFKHKLIYMKDSLLILLSGWSFVDIQFNKFACSSNKILKIKTRRNINNPYVNK